MKGIEIQDVYKTFLKLPVLFLIAACLIFGCSPPAEPKGESEITGIFAISSQDGFELALFYSDWDSLDFHRIGGCEKIKAHYVDKTRDLLLCVSPTELFFVDMRKKEKIKEITIPNNFIPDPYFGDTDWRIYPCSWNSRYCILLNRSVYLVDLKNQIIEKKIWDINSFGLGDKYILNSWSNHINNILFIAILQRSGIEERQSIIEIFLQTGDMQIVREYSEEAAWDLRFIFSNQQYICVYNRNNGNIIDIFEKNSRLPVGSMLITPAKRFSWPLLLDNKIIVEENETGIFYEINPEQKSLEIYMELFGEYVNCTRYQTMEGGDVYACTRMPHLKRGLVVNLSQKEIVRVMDNFDVRYFFLKED